ncbi:MAG TPA: ChaN family lipoprotein [Chitinophagaceae bacterium]|nr:ChaN family lipoprotein [Chitinophagaceae bacterium]
MKYFMCCLFCLAFMYASAQEDMSVHFKIYDTRNKEITTIDKIVSAMENADVLFFGEEHNDSAGHFLENKIFQALYERYRSNLVLSMEMFEKDNQLVLNEYLNRQIDETRLGKDARLWPNYKDYRPMVEFAKENYIPVIAANTPRRYVSLVTKKGMRSLDSLSKEAKMLLPPLPYDTLSGKYHEKFIDIMQGSPGAGSGNIYYSQSLWDAGMSYSIYQFLKKNKGKKVFHCVGKFHCDEKLGTAAQLLMRNKKLAILNISCFPDKSFANPDWSGFDTLGDFVILTDPDLKKTF